MNLASFFRIAKAAAPVLIPLATVAAPVIKAAVKAEKARNKPRG